MFEHKELKKSISVRAFIFSLLQIIRIYLNDKNGFYLKTISVCSEHF